MQTSNLRITEIGELYINYMKYVIFHLLVAVMIVGILLSHKTCYLVKPSKTHTPYFGSDFKECFVRWQEDVYRSLPVSSSLDTTSMGHIKSYFQNR